MAGKSVTYAECCYVCKHRSFLVTNYRSRCELDKKYRGSFGVCDKFEMTEDKEVLEAATLVTKPSDKWHL